MKYFLLSLIFSQLTLASTYNSNFKDDSHEGFECEGTELTAATLEGLWDDYLCLEGEWMIKVHEHSPVTVKLKPYTRNTYSLIPTIPTEPKVRTYLRQHWLRISFNGEVGLVSRGEEIE